MLRSDPLMRVLFVDLTKRRFHVEERPEIFESSLGGTGAAIRLLSEVCPTGCDPLDADNPVVFAPGIISTPDLIEMGITFSPDGKEDSKHEKKPDVYRIFDSQGKLIAFATKKDEKNSLHPFLVFDSKNTSP